MSSKPDVGNKAIRALHLLYGRVENLQDYIETLMKEAKLRGSLSTDTDKTRYTQLLRTTVVCTEKCAPNPPTITSLTQHRHQNEIIFKVVERMQQKVSAGKNVLTLGFNKASGDEHSQMLSSVQVEYSQPNPSCTLLLSRSWRTLLSRVGDEIMQHLLESRSMFVCSEPSCYIQLTGPLIYDLLLNQSNSAPSICSKNVKQSTSSIKTGSRKPHRKSWYLRQKEKAIKRLRARPKKARNGKVPSPKKKPAFIIKKRTIMHSGNLREGLPVKHILNKIIADSTGVKSLLKDVFLSSEVKPDTWPNLSSFTCNSTDSTSCVDDSQMYESAPRLVSILKEFIKNRRRCSQKALYEKYCPESGRQRHLAITTKLQKPQLQAPVFTRGVKRSHDQVVEDSQEEKRETGAKRRKISQSETKCGNLSQISPTPSPGIVDTSDPNSQTVISLNLSNSSNGSNESRKCTQRRSEKLLKMSGEARRKTGCHQGKNSSNLGAPVVRGCADSPGGSLSTGELLSRNVDARQVYLWLRAVCRLTLPKQFLGTKRNQKKFFKILYRFIHAGKFEAISVNNLLADMQVKGKHWLEAFKSYQDKRKALTCMLYWVFEKYCISLLKGYFYITETTTYRNRVFYFRKNHWSILQTRAIQDAVRSGHFKSISKSETVEYLGRGSLGISRLWFLPKVRDLRPIVALGRTSPDSGKKVWSVNKQLANLFHVINFIKKNDRSLVGSSVMGREDIHASWRKLAERRLKEKDNRPLYMVKVDIEGCFDTMNQQLTIDIMSKYINAYPDYIVRHYAKVMLVQGKARSYFCRQVAPLVLFEPDVLRFTSDLQQGAPPLHGALIVDQVRQMVVTAEELIEQLKHHIKANLVTTGGKEYIQTRGISQGSVLSSLLCSFYYGHMEAEHLPSCHQDELLIRQIDDFLFVTPSIERAENFLNIMLKGIPSHNCQVNEKKTLTNFPVPGHPQIQHLTIRDAFPWCGLLFDPQTLSVRVDYSRYTGLSVSDTVSFDISQTPGQVLRDKLSRSIRLQCPAVLVDSIINCLETSISNLYQLMILVASKLVSCERSLPTHQRWEKNCNYFVGVILHLCRILAQTYRQRLTQVNAPTLLTSLEIEWLSLHGFLHVLHSRQSVYKPLAGTLQRHQRHCQRQLDKSRVKEMRRIVAGLPEVLFLLK